MNIGTFRATSRFAAAFAFLACIFLPAYASPPTVSRVVDLNQSGAGSSPGKFVTVGS